VTTTTPGTSPLPAFYSVTETAKLLKVSPRTVRRWIEKRDLTVHRFGRQLRITDSDLVTFIRQRREA
jgi:excisionase family DNA binding protein